MGAAFAPYGYPEVIVVDNGSEFAGQVLNAWAYQHGVYLPFATLRKPIENVYGERCNGKFRDECLNQNWFLSLADARATIQSDCTRGQGQSL